jgi:hypothetical protein
MIDELYRYKIKSQKLPKIFLEVDETILQATFVELLDYMTGKKVFFKASESKSGYTIIDGKVLITSKTLKNTLRKYFPYTEYKKLKEEALEKMKKTIF